MSPICLFNTPLGYSIFPAKIVITWFGFLWFRVLLHLYQNRVHDYKFERVFTIISSIFVLRSETGVPALKHDGVLYDGQNIQTYNNHSWRTQYPESYFLMTYLYPQTRCVSFRRLMTKKSNVVNLYIKLLKVSQERCHVCSRVFPSIRRLGYVVVRFLTRFIKTYRETSIVWLLV